MIGVTEGERLAKYTTVVFPKNRHSGYGNRVVVFAASQQDAINRAVDIGWAGRADTAPPCKPPSML